MRKLRNHMPGNMKGMLHIRALAALLLISAYVSLSSAADWQMYYKEANHSALNPDNGAKTDNVLWKFEIGESINPPDSAGFNHSFAISPPVMAEGTVYVYSYDGYLYAVDANNGKLSWKFKIDGGGNPVCQFISPSVVRGIVYIGSCYVPSSSEIPQPKGYLYALDAATGKLKWEYQTGHVVDSSPAVDNGSVYFGSDGVYALDNQNGKLKWKYDTVEPIQSPLVISFGNLYYKDLCGGAPYPMDKVCVYALDTNGKLKWKHEGGYVSLVSESMVFIVTGENARYIHALDTSSGNIKWSYQTGSPAPLFVSNGILYIKAIPGDVSVNKRFEAEMLMGSKTIPVLDGGDIEAISPLQKDQYGIWGLPMTLTDNGANKLRDAVIKYQVYNEQSEIVFYFDGKVIFEIPFSIALAYNIRSVPVKSVVISLGKDLDAENKTRAERLREAFEGKTSVKAIGLDIYSGEPVPTATLTSLNEYGEGTFPKVAYVEGVTYKYSSDFAPVYLYAIGEEAPSKTQPDASKNVAGFETTLSVIAFFSALYILKRRKEEE